MAVQWTLILYKNTRWFNTESITYGGINDRWCKNWDVERHENYPRKSCNLKRHIVSSWTKSAKAANYRPATNAVFYTRKILYQIVHQWAQWIKEKTASKCQTKYMSFYCSRHCKKHQHIVPVWIIQMGVYITFHPWGESHHGETLTVSQHF